jgi:5'-3' exonuclease
VGEVTAAKFLKEYGSMENLLGQYRQVKGKDERKYRKPTKRKVFYQNFK